MIEQHFLEQILCCPNCHGDLTFEPDHCSCVACHLKYPRAKGKFYFRSIEVASEITDLTDKIKHAFKRFPIVYAFLIDLISPVLANWRFRTPLNDAKGVRLNLGSGSSVVGPNVVNVDMFDYENVHVVADIHRLPFRTNTIDFILNVAVLEHVRDPTSILREAHRILRDGGAIYSVIPFMQPFHASPHDYQRYTLPGIEYLHRQFKHIDSGTAGGPVSGFLWVAQEFLALLLSFGVKPLRDFIAIGLMCVTWPVKFLDVLCRRVPASSNIASSFYYHGQKRSLADDSTRFN